MSTENPQKETFLEKLKNFSWAIILGLIIIIFFQTCSNSRKIAALNDKVNSQPTLEQIDNKVQIEGLKASKRMLYDNNAIIRTTVRPDDRMNQYDEEIKKLEAAK